MGMEHVYSGRYPSAGMKRLFPLDEDFRSNLSPEMDAIYSEQASFQGWADMEIYLAESQQELGLKNENGEPLIKAGYVDAMRKAKPHLHVPTIREIEKVKRHDVMAFLQHYRELSNAEFPDSGKPIHGGATSMFVGDNTELMQQRDALDIIIGKVDKLAETTLHYCPNRFDIHNDLRYALRQLSHRRDAIKARGAKGTSGTQDSYMRLFDNDYEKVQSLDDLVTKKMGFDESFVITGQTYPRIADFQLLSTLGVVAKALEYVIEERMEFLDDLYDDPEESVANLDNMMDELHFLEESVFSVVYSNAVAAAQMASQQWLERTLDDSSERRIMIKDSFAALDKILQVLGDHSRDGLPYEMPNDSNGLVELELNHRNGLNILLGTAVNVVRNMHSFAVEHKDTPTLGYTHYQVAQPTTYGKRIALWEYNYALAINELDALMSSAVADDEVGVSGRILDYHVGSVVTGFAVAAAKKANDMRLLQHEGELAEPFKKHQKGSSAMPHKRNPMKQERVNGLARAVITAFDRGDIPFSFLGADSILQLDLSTYVRDTEDQKGFTIFKPVVRRNLEASLPYLAAEPVLMAAVKAGRDRDDMHEVLRKCAISAREREVETGTNFMIDRMMVATYEVDGEQVPAFSIPPEFEKYLLDPRNYLGASSQQVDLLDRRVIRPLLEKHKDRLTDKESEVQV